MDEIIKNILDSIQISGASVPNARDYFDGQADAFLVYSPSNESVGLSGDDRPLELVEGWDIDIYATGNYLALCSAVKMAMINEGWTYRGAGQETYDEATKLRHRLFEFSHENGFENVTEEVQNG
jgi:hypothetical protein